MNSMDMGNEHVFTSEEYRPMDHCPNCIRGEWVEQIVEGLFVEVRTVSTCQDHGVTNFRVYDEVRFTVGDEAGQIVLGFGVAWKVVADYKEQHEDEI